MCIKKGNFDYCALAGCHYANHDCSIAPSRIRRAERASVCMCRRRLLRGDNGKNNICCEPDQIMSLIFLCEKI